MTDSNEKQEKRNTKNNYNLNHHPHKEQKLTLKILVQAIIVSAIFANSITILSDQDNKPSTSLWILNITAAIASSLGIIALYRHGLLSAHLFTIISSLRSSIRLKVIFLVAITSVLFVGYNIHLLLSSAEMY